jgi:hypothetical protein
LNVAREGEPVVDEAFNLIDVLESLPDPSAEDDDPELARLFEEDQADRAGNVLAADSGERDRSRRVRGMEKLRQGEVRSALDYYHLAMLLQHSDLVEHYHLGHELARRASDAGYEPAGWLAAAAMDRWLLHSGLPQRYGTQYTRRGGLWQLYRVDPNTTDDERDRLGVPRLAEALERAEEMNLEDL